MNKRIHLIAIGGAAMHNMALALHEKGFQITGSDDEIFEPSLSRLKSKGLLPDKMGWDPSRITNDIEAVILGMHARADNPEMLRATELGLKIYSYPEYLYEQSKDKVRVVIGGSHGKTTITSMILHVLKALGKEFDFMVGAQIEGFDTMVRLSEKAPWVILEGDEYLSSPIDRRPKFHLYRPHVAVLSGIAWDHINVFPTFENYVDQFRIFINTIDPKGTLFWCIEDPELIKLVGEQESKNARKQESKKEGMQVGYGVPEHEVRSGITYIKYGGKEFPLRVFGKHNLMNMEAARLVCEALGVDRASFYSAIINFTGAAKRLEFVAGNDQSVFYKDFAHSPSKLKATIQAMKSQFPDRKLIACMELHTFSSLNENFLAEYKNCMNEADLAIVYFNPHTIEHKKLKPITVDQVKKAFNRDDLLVCTESKEVLDQVRKLMQGSSSTHANLLMMTSGNFDGLDFKKLGEELFTVGG